MTDWLDVFDQMIYNEVLYSAPDVRQPAREDDSPPLLNQAIVNLFAAAARDTTVPDFLTTIVNRDEWWVAVQANGSFETMTASPGQFRKMLEREQPPSPKKKNKKPDRTGSGGTLLLLYDQQPEHKQTIKLTGRDLVRRLPAGIDGLLVHTDEQSEFEIDASNFALMNDLANERDLEEWLTKPAPGQAHKLMKATWYAEYSGDKNDSISTRDRLALVHSRPDRSGLGYNRRVAMTGEKLFGNLVEQKVGGALIEISRIGLKYYESSTIILSPAVFHNLLCGVDIRPGANPLPAQSLEEVKLWLDLAQFPFANRRFLDASLNGEKLVRVVVPESARWQAIETMKLEFEKPAPTLSPVFSLASSQISSETGFGPNPSRILCPGLLARELGAMAYQTGKYPEKLWRPGRWLVFGRLLNSKDIEASKRRLQLARELQKLIPQGADSIPLSSIQTHKGMTVFHDHHFAFTREWIDTTANQAQKYTRKFVWG